LKTTKKTEQKKPGNLVGFFRFYAGGRMDLTKGKFKPKSASSILQALSCRFCQWQLSNPSKLAISKKWKSRIALLVHNVWVIFSDGLSRQKPKKNVF